LRHITHFASFCGDNQSLIRKTEPIQRLKFLQVITLLAHKDARIVCEFVEESDDKLRKLQFAPTSVFFNAMLLEIKNVLRKKKMTAFCLCTMHNGKNIFVKTFNNIKK